MYDFFNYLLPFIVLICSLALFMLANCDVQIPMENIKNDARKLFKVSSDSQPLTGKIAIVTGSTNGLGKEIAFNLIKMGCKVIITSRSQVKCEDTLKEFLEKYSSCGKDDIFAKSMDTSNLDDVSKFVDWFSSKFNRLDFLVNNAATNNITKSFQDSFDGTHRSAQNYDITFATNYLGPVLLIELLFPILQHTSTTNPVRIVNIGSNSHLIADEQAILVPKDGSLPLAARCDVHSQSHWKNAYGNSKLSLMMYTYHMSSKWNNDKWKNKNLKIFAVTPGVTHTGMVPKKPLAQFLSQFMFSPHHATYSTLYALLSPVADMKCYYSNCSFSAIDSTIGMCIYNALKLIGYEKIYLTAFGGVLQLFTQKYTYGIHNSHINPLLHDTKTTESLYQWTRGVLRPFLRE